MKASESYFKHTLCWLIALALYVAAAGCSDEESTNVVDEPLSVAHIVVNPKSSQPGDTVSATADIRGSSQPGVFPSIKWTESDGTLLTDNLMTVDWVAPLPSDPSTVARLTCTVTNSAGSSTMSADVFVGQQSTDVSQNGGEVRPRPDGTYYYLFSPPGGESSWDSSTVYYFDGTSGSPVVPTNTRRGAEFVFSGTPSADPTYAAFEGVDDDNPGNLLQPVNVWLVDLAGGTQGPITSDRSAPGTTRHHQYTHARFSLDGELVTYQAFLPNPVQGLIDTSLVYVAKISAGTVQSTVNATENDIRQRRLNAFPSISSDRRWVVYVSDGTTQQTRNRWELFGQPIDVDGNVDSGAERTLLSPANADGFIDRTSWTTLSEPLMAWSPNPSIPKLAVIGWDGIERKLHIMTTSLTGAQTLPVDGLEGEVKEFVWSSDGAYLAVITQYTDDDGDIYDRLYIVENSGTIRGSEPVRFQAPQPGDQMRDMAWSPNSAYIVFRVARTGRSWFELIERDGSDHFVGSLVLTNPVAMNTRGDFASRMATNAAYNASNVIFMLNFPNSPSIVSVSVQGAVP